MLTAEQEFWILMILSPMLALACVFYRRVERALTLIGVSPTADLPGLFSLRVVGAVVGIAATITVPLIRWWLF